MMEKIEKRNKNEDEDEEEEEEEKEDWIDDKKCREMMKIAIEGMEVRRKVWI
jgi:hypothetical protein